MSPESTLSASQIVVQVCAGIYFSTGLICLWAASAVGQQGTLVYLLAFGVFLAGCGRLLSMRKVGLPQPRAVWLGYLAPELVLPVVMAVAHSARPWQETAE